MSKTSFYCYFYIFPTPYPYTLRLHMLFSMNVRCCVYLCDFSGLVHGSRKHGYHPESDQVRFWPPNDPPHSRSRHQICVLVHFVHQCVPPLACFVRTAAKKGEEGSEHDQLYYPWGWGITVCVREIVCVCMCAHPSQQMFIVQHRASPMITGIHSTQKQWPYRTSCNCNQPVTKLQAKSDRHSRVVWWRWKKM